MTFEVRPIREEEREECIALWCTVWPADNDSYFRKYFFGDVEWLPYYTQVGVLDGQLVSVAHICKRTVACSDFHLTMGGLANVATLPEHRGKGYNTECLHHVIAVMEADAMDFTLLGTGINAYYERLAYQTLPWSWISGGLYVGANLRVRPSPQDVRPGQTRRSALTGETDLGLFRANNSFRVRPAEAGDVARIRDLYREYNRERPIAVQRTAAYWRDWIGISEEEAPADTLVAIDSRGRVQGYVRTGVFLSAVPYSEGAVGQRITELGVADEADELTCTRALLEAVAAGANAEMAQEFRVAIALEPSVLTVVHDLLTDLQQHHEQSMMIRLLHHDNLFRSLTPTWNERWIAAGRPPGQVSFITPYGAVTLDAGGQFIRVARAEQSQTALSQAAFFGLLFGLTAPETAACDSAQLPLLKALFPQRAAIYYSADGF